MSPQVDVVLVLVEEGKVGVADMIVTLVGRGGGGGAWSQIR